MKVLVDTSVWSLALRRREPGRQRSIVSELSRLIGSYEVAIIGPIRQELLSGIKEETQFLCLQEKLRAFPDIVLETVDYETAARFFNQCRAKGIQGSNTDFLMCAVGVSRGMSVFTTDKDFDAYRRVVGVKLHQIS